MPYITHHLPALAHSRTPPSFPQVVLASCLRLRLTDSLLVSPQRPDHLSTLCRNVDALIEGDVESFIHEVDDVLSHQHHQGRGKDD